MLTGPLEATITQENQLPRKVAILPFSSQAPNPQAGTIVRKMFYNFFGSLNYLDSEPSLIDAELRRNGMYDKIAYGEHVSPIKLGQLLNVDAVIFGDVSSLGKTYALVYADNEAGLNARMVDCITGQTVWELEHTVHLREGDVPLSLTGLAATIVKTAVSHNQATHMEAAAELCMKMVATVPNPPAISEPPPKIKLLVHNGAGKLLRPGDYLKVAMVGEEQQVASWSLAPLIDNLPLEEKEPGVYIGAYRIKPHDRLPGGRLVGYLKTDTGVRSQWMDTLGPLKIGDPTVLPPVMAQNTELNAEDSPYLVKGALVVKQGVKLTVNPGTVIWFENIGMFVKGELQILGTKMQPVRLAGLEASNWKGVILDHSRSANTIQYCQISDAEFGLRASDSNISIQNCTFQANDWGIVLENGSADIKSSLIRTSTKTGVAARNSQINISESVITENNSGGFLLENTQAKIEQNNIMNNGRWAVKVTGQENDVQAGHNWWGNDIDQNEHFLGPVDAKPALKIPIAYKIVE